jgi:hypothetical protein
MLKCKKVNTLSKFLIAAALIATLLVGCSRPSYTRQEVIDNFKNHEAGIMELAAYFKKQKPGENEVFFKPDGNRYTISIGIPGWAIHPDHPHDVGRDIRLNSARMDNMLIRLNWTKQTVQTLKEMLRNTNCEYISTDGDDIRLHYGTGDWSAYGYIIFDKSPPDSIVRRDQEAGVTFLRNNVRIASSGAL